MSMNIMTENAINYSIMQLFNIAIPNKAIKYEVKIERESRLVKIFFEDKSKILFLYISEDSYWNELLCSKSLELKWVNDFTETVRIPILFWGKNQNKIYENRNNNEIHVYADFLSATFFMLSRWEEFNTDKKDEHGRFVFEESVLYRHKFTTIPIVDEYAMILRKLLIEIFKLNNVGKHKFEIMPSHDIDDIQRYKGIYPAFRSILGDLIHEKSFKLFFQGLNNWMKKIRNFRDDPYFKGVYKLAAISEKFNLKSAFYFQTSESGRYDVGYWNEDFMNSFINELVNRKHEIGLHPGYETLNNSNVLKDEKKRLDCVLKTSKYGGRQHYLRFNVRHTWDYWDELGFEYDSSLGFAEHEGFRCGTCHPFRTYNLKIDKINKLVEIPLIIMDVTLRDYRKFTTKKAYEQIIFLINTCHKVEGRFTILWHNSSLDGKWKKWVDEVYIPSLSFATELIQKEENEL